MVVWKEIDGFDGYSISNMGEIRRDSTGRLLRHSINQYGVVCVGMMRNGVQRHRSVALLVAEHFVDRLGSTYDTPVHLNGHRADNRIENLVWRPRWFAISYNRQLRDFLYTSEAVPSYSWVGPVMDIRTGNVYSTIMDAAIGNGLLARDIYMSIHNGTVAWPTYQQFEFIPK